jgi:hypothetical protein
MEITGLVLNSMPLIISSLQFYIGGIATDKRYSRYRDKVQMLIAELRTGHTMCKNAIKIMFTGVLKHNELVEFFADPCAERWRDEKYNRMLKEHLGTNYEPYMEMITHILDTINAFMKRLKLDPSGKVCVSGLSPELNPSGPHWLRMSACSCY